MGSVLRIVNLITRQIVILNEQSEVKDLGDSLLALKMTTFSGSLILIALAHPPKSLGFS